MWLCHSSGVCPVAPPQDYGETPRYLHQRKEEVQRAQQEYDQYVSDRMKEGAMKMLSGEERISIMAVRGRVLATTSLKSVQKIAQGRTIDNPSWPNS